jgi:hypothetical protein
MDPDPQKKKKQKNIADPQHWCKVYNGLFCSLLASQERFMKEKSGKLSLWRPSRPYNANT